jgi:solute carrier family 25 protein 33/36
MQGLQPLLVGIIPTRAIYFWAYQSTKTALNGTLGNSPLNHLASAFAAGISSNTITNPLWMVKTRYQIIGDAALGQRVYTNYGEVIQSIWKEEGFRGFFKGLTASYVGCFEGAIQWIAYERLKAVMTVRNSGNEKDKKLSPSDFFGAAAASKFLAICATYPHEVVRTRLREQSSNGAFKYTGFMATLKTIAKEEGVRGLYGGMPIHLLRSVPNAAIMFLTFEVVNQWLVKADKALLIAPNKK